jgi:hypothetical protein
MTEKTSRREFLKSNGAFGLGAVLGSAALTSGVAPARAAEEKTRSAPLEKVRIGVIGMGGRGNSLMGNLLTMKEDVEIGAVGDIHRARALAAQARVAGAGFAKPETYFGDENVWKKLVDRDDLDAIVIASY